MGVTRANDNLLEKNKEALQSETWRAVRGEIKEKRGGRHFTDEITDGTGTDNAYGWIWNQVVNEYLRSGYAVKGNSFDIVVMGITYKVLKREKVTFFYDADGNTLFDVENKRLEKEYGWIMGEGLQANTSAEKLENKEGVEAPAGGAIEEVIVSVRKKAKEKLEKEMKADKDKSFAEPVIGYLLKRCEEGEGLAQDVVQEHKTWKKCVDYICEQARKQAVGNRAVIRNDVVYEWAEDYYHKDDKAEEEEKARKEAERKAKQKKAEAERKARAKDKPAKTMPPTKKKEDTPKEQPKPKKNGKDMEGQLDLFSMMGM